MTLKEDIKAEASRLGFPFSGFSLPEPPSHLKTFQSWVDQGCHAGMAFLSNSENINKRSDPRKLFPACQSILSLATPYLQPDPENKLEQGRGQISNYAWGKDYHLVLKDKMVQLVRSINNLIDYEVKVKACVDTAPILEKDYAQSAGLGWIGKNSCLIIPRYGSYFFLCELLLDLPIEPDIPFSHDGCKNCTLCQEACPTNAIRPDRSIDARRCLSYLTIEHRGSIPIEFRENMASHIFGCDICQSVCPHNKSTKTLPVLEEMSETLINPYPPLEFELTLTDDSFKQKYKNTAVLRTKRQGYLRNVIVALGNNQDHDAISVLKDLAEREEDEVIKEVCDWSLSKFSQNL